MIRFDTKRPAALSVPDKDEVAEELELELLAFALALALVSRLETTKQRSSSVPELSWLRPSFSATTCRRLRCVLLSELGSSRVVALGSLRKSRSLRSHSRTCWSTAARTLMSIIIHPRPRAAHCTLASRTRMEELHDDLGVESR